MNYGLRYDVEFLSKFNGLSYGSDRNNFGPRFALSYDLTGHGRTILKVSSGLYYDRIFQNPVTSTFRYNQFVGTQLTATWTYGQVGAPVYPATFPNQLPANAPNNVRDVYLMPGVYRIPTSAQVVGALNHAFSDDFAVTASMVYTSAWGKELLSDTNLLFNPATGLFVRPNPSYRQINQFNYDGKAQYTALMGEVRKRWHAKLDVGANVTIARPRDQCDSFGTAVDDVRYPELDYGPSADVPTFSMTANGGYQINRFAQVSMVFHSRSGLKYDARAGTSFQLLGDGNYNHRTPGITRNAFTGPGSNSLDVRFTGTVPIAKRRLQLTLEAFNVLNGANVQTIQNLYGPDINNPNPAFGSPLSYSTPRQIQLGVRLQF